MASILTITFSPCIDKSFSVPDLVPEKKLRSSLPKIEPGGGGINVARVISRLGGNSLAIYPSGGCMGQALSRFMEMEKIPIVAIETENETRENIIVLEESTNRQFRFIAPAIDLSYHSLQRIFQSIEEQEGIDYIVASGSLPSTFPARTFPHLAALAARKHAKLIVDTSGEALKQAVDNGVFLIKPNLSELAVLAGKKDVQMHEAADLARKIIENKQCEIIIVSLNAAGALLVTKKKGIHIAAPPVNAKSTVGAGDSMVAGIVFALSNGKSIETAAEYGVACGTAATLNAGTELCHKEDVERLLAQIQTSNHEARHVNSSCQMV